MSEYIKIFSAVIICCIVLTFVREVKKEYSLIIVLLCGSAVLTYVIRDFSVVINLINDFTDKSGASKTGIGILLKAVGISVVCQFACEVCADSGNRLLQFSVELIGKIAILLTSLPLVSTIIKIVTDYIK